MDTPTQPRNPNISLIIPAVAAIVIAAALVWYSQSRGNENTNTAVNTNANVNGNVPANENTNAASNTNAAVNENSNTGVNKNANESSGVNTSDWPTYTNTDVGYSLKYPTGWTFEEIYLNEDPTGAYETPIHYTVFYSPEKKFHFVIGVERAGAKGSIYYRTGIGAGDIVDAGTVLIAATAVTRQYLVFEDKVKEVFFYPVGEGEKFVEIDGYDVVAAFGPDTLSLEELNQIDVSQASEYLEVLALLETLAFSS